MIDAHLQAEGTSAISSGRFWFSKLEKELSPGRFSIIKTVLVAGVILNLRRSEVRYPDDPPPGQKTGRLSRSAPEGLSARMISLRFPTAGEPEAGSGHHRAGLLISRGKRAWPHRRALSFHRCTRNFLSPSPPLFPRKKRPISGSTDLSFRPIDLMPCAPSLFPDRIRPSSRLRRSFPGSVTLSVSQTADGLDIPERKPLRSPLIEPKKARTSRRLRRAAGNERRRVSRQTIPFFLRIERASQP